MIDLLITPPSKARVPTVHPTGKPMKKCTVNQDIATIVYQCTVELGLESPRSVFFVGLAGAAKIKQAKMVLLTPLQDVPNQ
jgi:hypothetical protein